MPARRALLRLSPLLLAGLLAACGSDEPVSYEPMRFDYLPPIPLNVASVTVEQRFFPAGVAPDVTAEAPVKPVQALRAMAEDRLRPFGATGRAVLAIQDASLTRRDGVTNGSFAVVLTIYNADGARAGFVEARVARRESGGSGSRPSQLYQMVRSMMDQMNIELEFQIRRNLKEFLADPSAATAPVQVTPLEAPRRP